MSKYILLRGTGEPLPTVGIVGRTTGRRADRPAHSEVSVVGRICPTIVHIGVQA